MRFRRLGQTDLNVSAIGFGASPLGDVFGVTEPAEGVRAVHRAIDQGINFFDVSPYYGHTLAESRLGAALAGRRNEVILATKCGRYDTDEFDFSAKRTIAEVDASLARLRTDYVDLLQVHDVEFGEVEQIITETLPTLRSLQEAGKARYIGITGYSLKTLSRIAESTDVDSVLSYCRYNLMVRDMDEELTPLARKRSIGLINASPLHMGILSSNEVSEWHPAPTAVRAAGRIATEICASYGLRLPEVALRFCIGHDYVATTLVGMSTVEEVERNLKALEPSDDAAAIQEVVAAIGSNFNYVWPSGKEATNNTSLVESVLASRSQ